jgi:hypothetical protein
LALNLGPAIGPAYLVIYLILSPSYTNILRVIKSRKFRWTGHVARMETEELHTGFWWGDLRERKHLKDQGV